MTKMVNVRIIETYQTNNITKPIHIMITKPDIARISFDKAMKSRREIYQNLKRYREHMFYKTENQSLGETIVAQSVHNLTAQILR